MITTDDESGGALIGQVQVVQHAGASMVFCIDDRGYGISAWTPSTGRWTSSDLTYVHAEDPRMAAFPDADNVLTTFAALSRGGRLLLAAGGHEQEPALWDFDSGEIVARTPLSGAYTAAVIALDEAFVTYQLYSDEIRLWAPDGAVTVLGHVPNLRRLALVRDGDRTLILGFGERITAWDATTLTEIGEYAPFPGPIRAATTCVLDQDAMAFSVVKKVGLYAWPFGAGKPLYGPVLLKEGLPDSMAVTNVDGRPLLVMPIQNSLRLRDAKDGTLVGRIPTSGYRVTAMQAATVDGRPSLVTGGDDGVLRIWDETDLAEQLRPV
ncbi:MULTISPECIES: WD40 repeat domain-containing protein [unclassified Spirillospora]|uniref:WD40 repeat domain-containing protein n=1 Tax=unclassified Spirillospora TaxID=2642701 RepID=UPI0037179B2B